MSGERLTPLPPGSTIGILGGGQLGRMLAMAAAALGYRCHVFSPEPDAPAAQVAAAATVATFDDGEALSRFAAAVDVVTLEFENIPLATVEHLAAQRPVRPAGGVLRITQDRLLEKDFVSRYAATAPYAAVTGPADFAAAVSRIGPRGILKTRRFGYDGKGQRRIETASATTAAEALAAAWADLGSVPCILEGVVDFGCEVSVLVARNPAGETAVYVPVENRHRDHILDVTLAPAAIAESTAEAAEALATALAGGLGLVGMLAVEMFIAGDGRLLVNELAPRVHNSGHWTIEACVTSQFEQQVRAVCGLPLGSPRRHSDARMQNLIGPAVDGWQAVLTDPDNKLHLYGKADARPGRKMGHVTRLYPLGRRPPG